MAYPAGGQPGDAAPEQAAAGGPDFLRPDQSRYAAGAPPETVEITASTRRSVHHLAALTAKAVDAVGALVHLREGPTLRLLGGYRMPAQWAGMTGLPTRRTLAHLVITTGLPVVIDDLSTDPRVPHDSPLATAFGRSYAGYPVRDRSDRTVGVCAVWDVTPRPWTEAQREVLSDAAQACGAFVTEQEAYQAADHGRRFLDAVLESLRSPVAAVDEHATVVLLNAAARELIPGLREGYRPDETLTGSQWWHPDGRSLTVDELPSVRALHGERIRAEELLIRVGGRADRLMLADAEPITDAQGDRLGAVVALTDITEARRQQRYRDCQLRVSTALAEASRVEDVAPNVVAAVGSTLGWAHCELWLEQELTNVLKLAGRWTAPRWQEQVRIPEELSVGSGLTGRVFAQGRPLWATDAGQPGSLLTPGEVRAPALRTAVAAPVRSGRRPIGALTVFTDTADEPEEALVALLGSVAAHMGQFIERRRAEELELQLAHSNNEYLSLVGHELRTPLTSISSYAALLAQTDPQTFATEGPELIRVIDRNATALRELVDDLLDLAALESEHTPLKREPVNLADTVRDSVGAAGPVLAGARVTVSVHAPRDLVVLGDPHRLGQLVDGLLGDAIAHTPDGGRVHLEVVRANQAVAEFSVTDTGDRVVAERLEHYFARFERQRRSPVRPLPGTGLALAISRAVVRRHGGTINVAPAAGEESGTRVTVRLPLSHP